MRRLVDKDILPSFFAADETVTFGTVEPLDGSLFSHDSGFLSNQCTLERFGVLMNMKKEQYFQFRRALGTVALSLFIVLPLAGGQTSISADEIPLERCDRLPVVRVHAGEMELHLLVDTGATTMLNLKSFTGGSTKQIRVSSWSGTADTSAREVSLSTLTLGSHTLRNLKLPAIDLSPIGKACGGPIDGILGVDLLDQMNATIDLKRRVASFGGDPADAKVLYQQMEGAMGHCTGAFEQAKAEELEQCFDPEIVLYCPKGEYRGRNEVMRYMREEYFRFAPNLHYTTKLRDVQAFGDALWYSYDFEMTTPEKSVSGRGMAMCRKSLGHWAILNMHNSLREQEEKSGLPKEKE